MSGPCVTRNVHIRREYGLRTERSSGEEEFRGKFGKANRINGKTSQ